MILTGSAIGAAVTAGDITIDPFVNSLVNPNSYNYRLSPVLRVTDDEVVEPEVEGAYREFRIPEGGMVLHPGRLYLGTTVEIIGSSVYVPSLIGRSSLGRLGMFLQVSADLGQLGAVHRWTLEIVVVQPIRVYARMIVGQVSFWTPQGAKAPYRGFYGRRSDPTLCDPDALRGALTGRGLAP